MRQFYPTLILVCVTSVLWANTTDKFNLGFEKQSSPEALSYGWFKWGDYTLSIDTLCHSGKRAGKITSDESGHSFGSIAYRIPAYYTGMTITLSGYMRTVAVEGGFAGLILRIDDAAGVKAIDNMQSQSISGTHDWTEYSVTLDYPKGAEQIYVGGILSGKGEAWFDDFILTIDGQDVQTLPETDKSRFPAGHDEEFDSGSNITFPELTPMLIDNLEILGRVWGHLKYYHPAIGDGNFNWDYELFRFLPTYLNAKDVISRDNQLSAWIDQLGEIPPCQKCKPTAADAILKPDLDWIGHSGLSSALQSKLQYVYDNRHQGAHYYISMHEGAGHPVFRHEDGYATMSFPDPGFRLLALYRYWNMVYYFSPYKPLTDKDWNAVLKDHIADFINAENERDYEFAALGLIGEIQDSHSNIWNGAETISDWKGNRFAPVYTSIVEGKLVVTGYNNPNVTSAPGLNIGDMITEINGRAVDETMRDNARYYPASNSAARMRDMSIDILRSNESSINLTCISHDGIARELEMHMYPRDSVNISPWFRNDYRKCFRLLDNNIGYITLQSIKDEDVESIKRDMAGTRGIIIDIRNYPSAFVWFSLGSYFIHQVTPFVMCTNGNVDNPGEFVMTEPLQISPDRNPYQGKLVVLINEFTQSAAEFMSMAFRAGDNTTIIGSTTAGADGDISFIFLPGGIRTSISGIGVYYPDGTKTQRVGIIPDIEIHPTIAGIREGRDELLEKAIEVIMQE